MTRTVASLLAASVVSIALVVPLRAEDKETPEQAAEAARLEKLLDEGDAHVKAKEYAAAKPIYKRVINETGKAAITQAARGRIGLRAVYASAANFALLGEKENAHGTLAWLPKLGFTAWDKLAKDPAFTSLHEDAEWKKLLAAHTSAPAPAAAGGPSREFLDSRLYRSTDGGTVMRVPDHDGWTIQRPGANGLVFFLGDAKEWTARVTLDVACGRFAKNGETDLELAKSVASLLARELHEKNPWLESKDEFKGRGVKVANGTPGWQQLLAGKSEKQGEWTFVIAALAHGARAAVAVIATTPRAEAKAHPFAQKLMEALRQGDQVPRLAARDPGTALEGVYRGNYSISYGFGGTSTGTQHWYVFDKRGYATQDDAPSSERWLDVEMVHQGGSDVFAYTVKGAELELVRVSDKKKYTLPFKKLGERKLEVEGYEFHRVDGGFTNGVRLAGRWKSSSYHATPSIYGGTAFSSASSSDYTFKADGTFKSSSFVSADLAASPLGPGVHSSGGSADGGKYEIKDDRLVLTYSNGVVGTHTFYAHRFEPDKKPPFDSDILYIDGSNYLRQKE